ncbi:MAG: FliH/SctL family protein [Acetatifactor sp.]
MSRNLLIKQMFAVVDTEDKRVIDTNSLVQKRMDELAEKMKQTADDGFVSGLNAQEVQELLKDENGEIVSSGNIIKANEDASKILEQAREEAAGIVAEAQAQVMQMLKNAQTEAEVEKNRILGEAKQQGYQEGHREAEAEAQAVRREYAEKEKQLEAAVEAQLQDMEPQLVDTITAVYEHIFHVELGSYREILTHLISTTLRKTEGGQEFIIHVSQEDYPYVSMQKKQLLAGVVAGSSRVDVVEDLALGENDCIIETDGGIFDCGLGTQLSELRQKLLLLSWSKEE